MAALLEGLHRSGIGDPLLAPFFEAIELNRLKAHEPALLSQVLGGPDHCGAERRDEGPPREKSIQMTRCPSVVWVHTSTAINCWVCGSRAKAYIAAKHGIGISTICLFPERQELVVRLTRVDGVARYRVRPTKPKMGDRSSASFGRSPPILAPKRGGGFGCSPSP